MAEIKNFYYTQGNAARQIAEPLPNRHEIEEEKRRKREEQIRRNKKRQAAKMRQKRMNAIYMIALVGLVGGLFVFYVNLSNSITTHRSNISALETQVSDLKAENSTLQSQIAIAANLNDIKERAINDLGMVYADSDQIVYYEVEESDYMSQYSDVPQ